MSEPNNEYLSGVGISSRKYKRLLLSIECKLKEILSEIDINASASTDMGCTNRFQKLSTVEPFHSSNRWNPECWYKSSKYIFIPQVERVELINQQ